MFRKTSARGRSRNPKDEISTVGQKLFHDPGVLSGQDRRAPLIADELLGPLDHAVLLAGLVGAYLSAAGDAESLFRAALGFELGHFACLHRLCGQEVSQFRVLKHLEPPRHAPPDGSRRVVL